MPSGPPPLVFAADIIAKHLVLPVPVDVEIKTPVGMVHMVGVTRQSAAMNDRMNFSVPRDVPCLINVVFADSGVDPQLQPFHIVMVISLRADFLVATIRNGHDIRPTQPILERTAPAGCRTGTTQ